MPDKIPDTRMNAMYIFFVLDVFLQKRDTNHIMGICREYNFDCGILMEHIANLASPWLAVAATIFQVFFVWIMGYINNGAPGAPQELKKVLQFAATCRIGSWQPGTVEPKRSMVETFWLPAGWAEPEAELPEKMWHTECQTRCQIVCQNTCQIAR